VYVYGTKNQLWYALCRLSTTKHITCKYLHGCYRE